MTTVTPDGGRYIKPGDTEVQCLGGRQEIFLHALLYQQYKVNDEEYAQGEGTTKVRISWIRKQKSHNTRFASI